MWYDVVLEDSHSHNCQKIWAEFDGSCSYVPLALLADKTGGRCFNITLSHLFWGLVDAGADAGSRKAAIRTIFLPPVLQYSQVLYWGQTSNVSCHPGGVAEGLHPQAAFMVAFAGGEHCWVYRLPVSVLPAYYTLSQCRGGLGPTSPWTLFSGLPPF